MPPPPDLPDYRTPSPDVGHESIRVPLAKAIDDLAQTVADLTAVKTTGKANRTGVDDAYFLTDLLFDLLGSALTAIDDLTARVAALEAVVPPPPIV